MADRLPFVDFGDEHGELEAGDRMVDPNGLPFLTAADGGGLKYYADLATAIADGANLVAGQWVSIGGGDNAGSGYTDADAGLWVVNTDTPTVAGDFDKRLNIRDHAAEIELLDSNNWYGGQGTTAESALNQIGDKQVYYRLGDTSLFGLSALAANSLDVDAVISALVIDSGTQTDSDGVGSSTVSGIIVNEKDATPQIPHRIPIRDSASWDPIDDGSGNEVYARLDHDSGAYVLKFFSNVSGTETAYTFAAPQTIDLAFVQVSQDFMKLPAHAGITDSHFFGDQAGAVGTITDEQVTTNSPAFQYLLSGGLLTQEQVNNRVDLLGSTANGEGASLVGIEAISGLTATDVQGALEELNTNLEQHQLVRYFDTIADALSAASTDGGAGDTWQVGDVIAITGPGADSDERGLYSITGTNGTFTGDNAADYLKIVDISHTASEVAVEDVAGNFTGTDVEAVLAELATSVGANHVMYDYTSIAAAVAAQGTDGHKVGDHVVILNNANHAEDGIYRVTALTPVVGDYLKVYDAFNAASEVSFDNAASGATATTVQAALDEIFAASANMNGHHDYANLAAAVAAADDTWLVGDYLYIQGDAGNETERGVWKVTGNNGTDPGDNPADYTKVLDISHTAAEIPIADAGGLITATNVEAALQELAGQISATQGVHAYDTLADAVAGQATQLVGDFVIIAGVSPSEDERGIYSVAAKTSAVGDYAKELDISHTAAEVLIGNGGGADFTGTSTQAALDELLDAIGGASTTVRAYSSTNYVAANDNLVVAIGKLDAAISALSSNQILDVTFVAAEAISASTGPKLVAMTGTGNNVELANASDTGTNVEIAGIAVAGTDYNASDPMTDGVVTDGVLGGFTGLTPGAPYYADPTVEGGITSTVPSTVGQWVVPVGVAKSATELVVRIGEPTEIVPAQKALGRNVWFRDTSATAGDGIGETGFTMEVGDIWIDNDTTVQNPRKNGTGRYTQYMVKVAWTGAGSAITSQQIKDNFIATGKQG
jgi:hypothetical protein